MPRQYSGRAIQRNHGNPSPRYIVAIDCESTRTSHAYNSAVANHTFRLATGTACRIAGGKAIGVHSSRFNSAEDLRSFVYDQCGNRHTTWVIAHGMLADFRLGGFADDIDNGTVVIDAPRARRVGQVTIKNDARTDGIVVVESPPTIIGLRHVASGGRMIFVDTLNWFRCPLRDLGQACGLPKLTMPAWDASDEEWFIYCHRDTEILFQTFTKLIHFAKEQQLGVFRYTAASQAMSVFRHRFMQTPIYVHDNAKVKAWERKAYFGGRSEVFKWGKIDTQCHLVDVNSLFPSVMKDIKVPVNLVSYDEYTMVSEDISEHAATSEVAEVLIQTSRPIYPVRREGTICYPVGRFWTYLCGPELALAARNGEIESCRRIARYDCAIIFDRFVSEFWKLRQSFKQEGNSLYDTFTKSIMNSLYGKWTQKQPQWQPCEDIPGMRPWSRLVKCNAMTGERTEYRTFGSYTQQRMPDLERSDTFVAIGAFVTAAARIRMNTLRETAGYKNVYYQGVDGLIVNDMGLTNLERAEEVEFTTLGKLRLEYSGSQSTIYGVADYRLGSRNVMAGRPASAIQVADNEFIATMLSSKQDLFNGVAPVGMEEWQQTVRRKCHYHKGIVGLDQWVTPHEYSEPQGSGVMSSTSPVASDNANSSTINGYANGSPSDQISEALSNTLFASSILSPSCERIRSLF